MGGILVKILRSGALALVLLFLSVSMLHAADSGGFIVNKVAAVVNGEMITLFDVQRVVIQEINRRGITGDDQQSAMARERVFSEVLDSMIMEILLEQEAERYKVTVSDSEVDNEISKIIAHNQISQKDLEAQLALQGSSLTQLKSDIRKDIIRKRMVTLMVARKVQVSKEEVADYYEKNRDAFSVQDAVELSMILFAPSANAASVLSDIRSGKVSFAAAAREYSTASTASMGGSLGVIPWKDLNREWQGQIVHMQPGEVSDLLNFSGSNLILQLNSKLQGEPKTFEEVAPQIEEILLEPKLNERFREYSDELRRKAVVDIKL